MVGKGVLIYMTSLCKWSIQGQRESFFFFCLLNLRFPLMFSQYNLLERERRKREEITGSMHKIIKAGPPWFEFLVIFHFFAPWYRRSREASSVKIS